MNVYSHRGFTNDLFPPHLKATVKRINGEKIYRETKTLYVLSLLEAGDLMVLLEFEDEEPVYYLIEYSEV